MACSPAPVATAFYEHIKSLFPGKVYFLGICGDASHQTRKSGHNSGAMRELSCTDPRFAHAVDIGVTDRETALKILAIGFELEQVHYQIFDAVGYRPRHRGGARFASAGHDHHVHTSFGCGSTFDTDFGDELMASAQEILDAIKELDEDLPERGGFNRLQARVINVEEDLDVVKADVKAIRQKLGA